MDNNKTVKIRGKTAKLADKVKKTATKINTKTAERNLISSKIDKLVAQVTNPDYLSAKKSYDNVLKNIKKAKGKLKKSKSSGTIKDLSAQLFDLSKNRKQLANSMKNIATNNGFEKVHNQITRENAQLTNIENLLKGLSTQKSITKNAYIDMKNKLKALQQQNTADENSPVISDKVKQAKQNGFTALYRTDMQDSTVFSLIETEPNRSDTNQVASHSVDSQASQTDYVTRDTQELSGTYLLTGKNLQDAMNQFEKLSKWSAKYEFTINGFAYSQHAYISSISASTSSSMNANTISLDITFQYARQANIKYARKSRKRKAPAKKKAGRRRNGKAKYHYIKVKPGMTYSSIANKTGVSLSSLMKMNKWGARSIPVGAKVRYK